jgi:hypothetical protein
MKFFRTAGLLVLLADALPAQNPPAAADLIRSGGFESTLQAPNLWTGVDFEPPPAEENVGPGHAGSFGARGSAKVQYNHANEHDKMSKDFKSSASWTTFSEKFTVHSKNRDLKDEKTTHKAVLIIALKPSSPDGTLHLNDLKLARGAS